MKDTHPIKTLRHCPKCGSYEFNPSGTRSLLCMACGFHFFINAAAAVAALIVDENERLMLVTRGIEPDYGKLDLPGGFIDPGESAEEAIKRELTEELGLEVRKMEYAGSAPNEYIYSAYSVFTLDLAFLVSAKELNHLKAMDDILDYRFYHEKDFDYEEIAAPSIRNFVRQYFSGKYI